MSSSSKIGKDEKGSSNMPWLLVSENLRLQTVCYTAFRWTHHITWMVSLSEAAMPNYGIQYILHIQEKGPWQEV